MNAQRSSPTFVSIKDGSTKRSANLKRSVANAEVVDLPRAGHYVFLTREAEVLSGIHRFVMTLK